jgi:hypothetical protein
MLRRLGARLPARRLSTPDVTAEPRVRTPDDRLAWYKAVAAGLAALAVSRLCVLVGAATRGAQLRVDAAEAGIPPMSNAASVSGVFTGWDGLWYLRIAREGYPRFIPPDITYFQPEARAAFFPLYPAVVRWTDAVLPGGDTAAALAVNAVLSVIAVVLVGLLARRLFGIEVATTAMVLFCVFPGSFVLTYAYSEALLIVLSAACLLLLLDRRWVLAGIAAALATATRPNGLALALACAVAAFEAIRTRREWSALVAPVLAPIGYIGFQVWLAGHTGEATPWWRVQREAWDEGWSFGWAAVERVGHFLVGPFSSPTSAITVATLASLGLGVWAMWRFPMPAPVGAYTIGIVVLMLVPSTVTARPRFLFTAFPLLIAVAAWLPRRRTVATDLMMVGCGAGLVGLTMLYAVLGAVP